MSLTDEKVRKGKVVVYNLLLETFKVSWNYLLFFTDVIEYNFPKISYFYCEFSFSS